jgi:2-oxo-4-hydroxy-4-carboxy-5-ureidoimidazoline decarboxylase
VGLAGFNALPADRLAPALRACCAAPQWADAVAAGRPYPDRAALHAVATDAVLGLDGPGLEAALTAHPRIGERAAGTGREAGWSRQEQSGATGTHRAALAAGNRAYEERFGHVFLICATGLSAVQMLAALRTRLGNDPAAERAVVRTELAKIACLRLDKLLDGAA